MLHAAPRRQIPYWCASAGCPLNRREGARKEDFNTLVTYRSGFLMGRVENQHGMPRGRPTISDLYRHGERLVISTRGLSRIQTKPLKILPRRTVGSRGGWGCANDTKILFAREGYTLWLLLLHRNDPNHADRKRTQRRA